MVRQGHGHIVNTASMAGLTAARPDHQLRDEQARVVGLSLALRSEAAGRGVGVLAVCPTAVETPILDKGAIGGFVGRDFYKMGQRSSTFSSADDLAQDTLRAIERNKALLVWPRQARRPGCSPGWHLACCNECRSGSSTSSGRRRRRISAIWTDPRTWRARHRCLLRRRAPTLDRSPSTVIRSTVRHSASKPSVKSHTGVGDDRSTLLSRSTTSMWMVRSGATSHRAPMIPSVAGGRYPTPVGRCMPSPSMSRGSLADSARRRYSR